MTWLYIGLVVLVVAAVAAVAVGHGDGLAVAPPDRREVSLPAGRPLTSADVAGVGLSVGLRGYRMDEVDDLLARLGAEIDERAERLRVLEAGPVGAAESVGPAPASPAAPVGEHEPVREHGPVNEPVGAQFGAQLGTAVGTAVGTPATATGAAAGAAPTVTGADNGADADGAHRLTAETVTGR